MGSIVSGIRLVSDSISRISVASAEQSTALAEISSAIGQLDEITQRNAEMVEHAVDMSGGLEVQARSLTDAIGKPDCSADDLAKFDEAAKQVRDAVTTASADGTVTKDEAKGVRDLAKKDRKSVV